MNENINLVEILKDCKKGTKFYSSVYGDLVLESVCTTICLSGYPIIFTLPNCDVEYKFTKDGKCYRNGNGECCIFPSRDQRDWNKFKILTERFNPESFVVFDRVIVRDFNNQDWCADFFSHLNKSNGQFCLKCTSGIWKMCIPYNAQTQHLVGTNNDCPEYYKWWKND